MDVAIRGWTFTHWWVRPVVKIWFDVYHKSVTYSGTGRINWDKPIIFAPSHQNAFSDALCLILPTEYTNNRFIYPLIRADAFGQNKALDWVLTSFHMMPVYRPRDKVDLKQKNKSVFSDCYEILAQKRNLLIHPEGNCIPKKRVGKFKKGLARIALGAEEAYDFALDVQVIPVGINYRSITEPRKGIHIQYGQPILANNFADQYRQHSAAAITQLTTAVKKSLEQVTVDVKSDECYELAEECMALAKSGYPEFVASTEYTEKELHVNKQIGRKLNEMNARSPDALVRLNKNVTTLKSLLDQNNLNPLRPLVETKSFSGLFFEPLIYLVLLPLVLWGWINNIIPWVLIHKVADKIAGKQFKSSARMTAGLLIFPICYLLQSAVVLVLSDSWLLTAAYIFSAPFAGILSLNVWENIQDWLQQFRLQRMQDENKRRLKNLLEKVLSPFGI